MEGPRLSICRCSDGNEDQSGREILERDEKGSRRGEAMVWERGRGEGMRHFREDFIGAYRTSPSLWPREYQRFGGCQFQSQQNGIIRNGCGFQTPSLRFLVCEMRFEQGFFRITLTVMIVVFLYSYEVDSDSNNRFIHSVGYYHPESSG